MKRFKELQKINKADCRTSSTNANESVMFILRSFDGPKPTWNIILRLEIRMICVVYLTLTVASS